MHWWLRTRNKPALLWAVLAAFPKDARLSLEGDLKSFGLLERADASSEETPVLHRHTRSPKLDFVILPVSPELLVSLQKALAGSGVFNTGGALVHAQVEYKGKLLFGAYDNFHNDCVVAYEPIATAFLEQLRDKGILRAYESAA